MNSDHFNSPDELRMAKIKSILVQIDELENELGVGDMGVSFATNDQTKANGTDSSSPVRDSLSAAEAALRTLQRRKEIQENLKRSVVEIV